MSGSWWGRVTPRRAVVVSVSLCLVVRALALVVLGPRPLAPDHAEYRALAEGLRRGSFDFPEDRRDDPGLRPHGHWMYLYRDHPSMLRPPVYPVVVLATETLLGEEPMALGVVNAAFDLGSAGMLAAVGSMWFGPLAGLAAGSVYAVAPGPLYTTLRLGRESLLTLLMLWGIWATSLAVRRRSVAAAGLAGLAFGLGGLTKETNVIAGVVCGCWLLWRLARDAGPDPSTRVVVRVGAAMALTVALILGVRSARNYHHFDTPSLSNLAAPNLRYGVRGPELETWKESRSDAYRLAHNAWRAEDGLEGNRRVLAEWRDFAAAHPAAVARSWAENAFYLHAPVPKSVWDGDPPLKHVVGGAVEALLLLVVLGVWRERQRTEVRLLVLIALACSLAHLPFISYGRFRVPFMVPLLVVVGALLARWLPAPAASPRRAEP